MSLDSPAHSDYLGVAAALTTSVLWTFTSLLFTAATRRIGAALVNALRLALAVIFHMITFRLTTGGYWPEMSTVQLWALVLSGVVGLSLCDQCWLVSLADLGPRRVMLLATSSPIFALVLGTLFLHERVAPLGLLGIAITIGGIVWVVMERRSDADTQKHPHALRGTILAICAAALQATGSLFSKAGMGHGVTADAGEHITAVTPQAASLVRMVFGFAGALPILGFMTYRNGSIFSRPRPLASESGSTPAHPHADRWLGILCASCGAITGPYLGVWLSLVAFNLAPLGIAQTLLSLQPVLVLPLAVTIMKDRVTYRAAFGAAIAVGGSVVLAIWGRAAGA